jgi:AraC family transcriptional activator of pobA
MTEDPGDARNQVPTFLRKALPPAPAPKGPVSCGSFALAQQGASWASGLLHDLPDHYLLWITKGQGRLILEGVRHGLSAHQLLFIPAGHVFSLDLPLGAQALYLRCPPRFGGDVLPSRPVLLRLSTAQAQVTLTGELDAITRELAAQQPAMETAITARIALIAVLMQRQLPPRNAPDPLAPNDAAARLVRRFARALARDFRSPKPMAEYARALEVTPTHLTRVCRQCCGLTAADMLTQRKLHAARLALAANGPAIKDIAADLGFASAAYFTRFIQNHTGMPPTALRRQARQKTREQG